MTPLETAVAQLQEEVDSYSQGTKNQPADGTVEFYLLRAHTLGLSYLKRLGQLDLSNDPPAAHRLFTAQERTFKLSAVPPPVEIPREVLQ